MKSAGEMGLIFNTSAVGVFPRAVWRLGRDDLSQPWQRYVDECVAENPGLSVPEYEKVCGRHLKSSEVTGGRLILTNLAADQFSTSCNRDESGDPLIPAVLSSPDIPLARAAALSANFPPVFSSAAIDVLNSPGGSTGTRFWVTDGGATDNRALVSLLFALRCAIEKHKQGNPTEWPPIHVIVADASKANLEYKQDRGISTGFSSKGKIASQLISELIDELKHEVAAIEQSGQPRAATSQSSPVTFHFLTMPTVLRANGLGTHWMMPSNVRFVRPASVSDQCEEDGAITMDGCAVRLLIERLYSDGRTGAASGKAECALQGASKTRPVSERPGDCRKRTSVERWIERDTYLPLCPVWLDIAGALNLDTGGVCSNPIGAGPGGSASEW